LEEALKAEGYSVQKIGGAITFRKGDMYGSYSGGRFDVRENRYGSQRFDVDAVKVRFSNGVVRKAAKRYGWQVVVDQKDPNHLQIKRRGA